MTNTVERFVVLRKEGDRKAILSWWESLDKEGPGRADRANLRRCESPEDVLLQPAFHRFLKSLDDYNDYRPLGLAMAAGLLAHVKENRPVMAGKGNFVPLLARQMGEKDGDKAAVSESRFTQLMKSRAPEEFYDRLRRILAVLDKKVNLLSLADCVLHWEREAGGDVDQRPARRFRFRMAEGYFSD